MAGSTEPVEERERSSKKTAARSRRYKKEANPGKKLAFENS